MATTADLIHNSSTDDITIGVWTSPAHPINNKKLSEFTMKLGKWYWHFLETHSQNCFICPEQTMHEDLTQLCPGQVVLLRPCHRKPCTKMQASQAKRHSHQQGVDHGWQRLKEYQENMQKISYSCRQTQLKPMKCHTRLEYTSD